MPRPKTRTLQIWNKTTPQNELILCSNIIQTSGDQPVGEGSESVVIVQAPLDHWLESQVKLNSIDASFYHSHILICDLL